MRMMRLLTLALIAANVATALPQRGRFAMVKVAADQGYTDEFVITIETAGADTFTLPLRSGYSYNFTVDWGDGSAESTITAFDDPDITHSYTGAGTYIVQMDGTLQAWYFHNTGDKLLLRTVENWGDTGFTGEGLLEAFYGCAEATHFAKEGLKGSVTTLRRTWGICSAAVQHADVNHLTAVNSLYQTWFSNSLMVDAPDVSDLSGVTTAPAAWQNCVLLVNPPDLSNMTLLQQLAFAFKNCESLIAVPALPSSSTALTNVTGAFDDIGAGMGGTVADLWNTTDYPNILSFVDAFTGATGLTNYGDIPDAWKGL